MKDFKSVREEKGRREGSEKDLMQEAQSLLSSFDGKSEDAVIREIVRRAEEGKRNGTLTNAQIDDFYVRFSPLLNDGQRRRIEGVIKRIKEIG